MSVVGEHGEIVISLGGELRNFVRPRRLGRLTGSDAGVWLERDPDTVREPDLAYISAEKLPLDVRATTYYEVVPDLVVEVASQSDTLQSIDDKARMWLSYGVRLVWVAFPDSRSVDVYPAGRRGVHAVRERHPRRRRCAARLFLRGERYFRCVGSLSPPTGKGRAKVDE